LYVPLDWTLTALQPANQFSYHFSYALNWLQPLPIGESWSPYSSIEHAEAALEEKEAPGHVSVPE
jgi:hypothetical protein